MSKEHSSAQETGLRQTIGTVIIGLGLVFMLYNILAASWMIPGYKQLGEGYWDTLSTVGIVAARLWALSFTIGSILLLVGGLLRTKAKLALVGAFVVGGLVVLALLVGFPYPASSSPIFSVGGTLIELLFLLTLWNWYRCRTRLEGQARTIADLRMVGYTFLALAASYTCGLGTLLLFATDPEELIHNPI